MNSQALALIRAIQRSDHSSVLTYLKDDNLEINARSRLPLQGEGRSALHHAAELGVLKIVDALLNHPQINLEVQGLSDQETPLHRAEDAEIVNALLARGAKPNAQDKEGRTPLHWAIYHRQASKLKALLEYRVTDVDADVNAKDKHGNTPLDYLFKFIQTSSPDTISAHEDLLVLLLEHRAIKFHPHGLLLEAVGLLELSPKEPTKKFPPRLLKILLKHARVGLQELLPFFKQLLSYGDESILVAAVVAGLDIQTHYTNFQKMVADQWKNVEPDGVMIKLRNVQHNLIHEIQTIFEAVNLTLDNKHAWTALRKLPTSPDRLKACYISSLVDPDSLGEGKQKKELKRARMLFGSTQAGTDMDWQYQRLLEFIKKRFTRDWTVTPSLEGTAIDSESLPGTYSYRRSA